MLRFLCCVLVLGVAASASQPRLLLTPQRLKRLKRDRERQTDRWNNFEKRVETVADSPERGFELALYSVVTGDAQRTRAAIDWALAHPCETRQVALVLDWTDATDAERAKLLKHPCPASPDQFIQARDSLFLKILSGEPVSPIALHLSAVPPTPSLYALAEYLDVYRSREGVDLRATGTSYFRDLPGLYLLSFHPADLNKPTWQVLATALALVTLDPNLPEAQFLQGWAMEDRVELREGPGVAYEFLWGNSYLPGVGYQNRQPWIYVPGRLTARTDWKPDACWIEITASGTAQNGCSGLPEQFGNLHLLSVDSRCLKLPDVPQAESVIVRAPGPGKIRYSSQGSEESSEVDAARLWRMPFGASGKVCWSASR